MPALDGSSLTGIAGMTKVTSDPLITTNPSSGVGTTWVNKSSGEMFVCTDATAGENVWINVGSGTGDIRLFLAAGSIAGFMAGFRGIEKFSFSSATVDASNHGDLSSGTTPRNRCTGSSSRTHGYTAGGETNNTSDSNVIDRFAFASNTNATDVGDMTNARRNGQGVGSATHGYCLGGRAGSSEANSLGIDKYSYSADGNSTGIGDMSSNNSHFSGSSSYTHGFAAGGYSNVTTIRRMSFSVDAGSSDVDNLSQGKWTAGGHSTPTHGYYSGGLTSAPTGAGSGITQIDKYSHDNGGTSTDHGDLQTKMIYSAGNSSTTHGYTAGGISFSTDSIIRFSFADGTSSNDVGNLSAANEYHLMANNQQH
jgi:hypothetical protein